MNEMENKEKRRGHTHFKTITEVCIHVLMGAWEYIRAHDCEGMTSRTSLWGVFFFPVTSNFSWSSQSFSQLACNRGTTSPRKLFPGLRWKGCWESPGGRRLQAEAKPPPPPPPATEQVCGDACETGSLLESSAFGCGRDGGSGDLELQPLKITQMRKVLYK